MNTKTKTVATAVLAMACLAAGIGLTAGGNDDAMSGTAVSDAAVSGAAVSDATGSDAGLAATDDAAAQPDAPLSDAPLSDAPLSDARVELAAATAQDSADAPATTTLSASTLAATKSFTAKTTLDGRTVKDPNVPIGARRVANKYPAGSKITLVCQDEGPAYHGSRIWDLTTDGLWVPDAYVDTNSTTMVMSRCEIPKKFAAKADLNGRKNKGDAADAAGAKNNAYQEGAQIPVDCQASAKGVIWDHTTDGWWVPDTYVKTGSDGFVAGLPRCDTDGATGGNDGGADPRASEAVAWAKARIGKSGWNNLCELFVEQAYGTRGRFATAMTHYNWQKNNGRIHKGSTPPAGAAVFFTSTTSAGHVMISIGGGKAISTGPTVYQTSTFQSRGDYLGWAYVPSSW